VNLRLAVLNYWLYVQLMSDSSSYIKPLLELFDTSLADVRFADVDGQALTRAVGDVESAEEELNAAQAVVDAAARSFMTGRRRCSRRRIARWRTCACTPSRMRRWRRRSA
jgi:hypothetical protein